MKGPGNPYDPDGPAEGIGPDTVNHERDPDERTAMAVVEAVAAATDREVTALPPMFDVVNPDALDALVRSDGTSDPDVRVSFPYAGTDVHVRSEGSIDVRLRPDASD